MSRRVTKEDFLQRCRQHHGDRYDYSRVDYIDTLHKVIIICRQHGPFEQLAYMHMRGHGCIRCSQQVLHLSRRISFADVQAGIHARFPHYQLDRSTFTRASTPVEIDCPIHDCRFKAKPVDIIRHGLPGCPECIAEARRRKRCAERRDPNADQHLRRIAEVLSERHAETYRYWLAGEFLAEIGDRYGVTAEAIRLRLKRVRQLLDAGRSAPDG